MHRTTVTCSSRGNVPDDRPPAILVRGSAASMPDGDRVVVGPGMGTVFDGDSYRTSLVVTVVGGEGIHERRSVLGVADALGVLTESLVARELPVVWLERRGRLRVSLGEQTVAWLETRLRETAADADALFVAWTGATDSDRADVVGDADALGDADDADEVGNADDGAGRSERGEVGEVDGPSADAYDVVLHSLCE